MVPVVPHAQSDLKISNSQQLKQNNLLQTQLRHDQTTVGSLQDRYCMFARMHFSCLQGGHNFWREGEYKDFSRTFNYLFHTYSSDVLSCYRVFMT